MTRDEMEARANTAENLAQHYRTVMTLADEVGMDSSPSYHLYDEASYEAAAWLALIEKEFPNVDR